MCLREFGMSDGKGATAVTVSQPSNTTNVTPPTTINATSNVTKTNSDNVIKSSDATKVASNGKIEETKKDALDKKDADKLG